MSGPGPAEPVGPVEPAGAEVSVEWACAALAMESTRPLELQAVRARPPDIAMVMNVAIRPAPVFCTLMCTIARRRANSADQHLVPAAGMTPVTRNACTALSMQALPLPNAVCPSPTRVRRVA